MKATAKDMVQALMEFAKTVPDREEFLRDVQRELASIVGEAGRILPVQIVTPSGDAGHLKAAIVKMIEDKTKRPVDFSEKADAGMIGGIIINFGDEQIDASVRTALQQAALSFGTSLSAS